jgi:putative tricarboxylic transport membrane protein
MIIVDREFSAPSKWRGGSVGRYGWKKPDHKSGIFFLLLGMAVCYFSWKIGLGSPAKPGPGFMPFLAGLLLAALSFVLVIQVLLSWTAPTWETRILWKNILAVLAAMVAYGLLLDMIGFVLITFAFVVILMKVIEPQSWRRAILGGIVSALASYLLFETLLKSQLPRTFLGFF